MGNATLWADATNSMWFGVGLLAGGIILAGVTLYLIVKKDKEVDNDG